ncbi:MAG: helix-turn-helix transcriptional regulator [Dehalococcoidia bacterium]
MSVRLPDQLPQVTPRQLEVARLVARGLTNPQIADELGITLDGAKYHVAELLGRLGLSSREEIATWYRDERHRRRVRRVRLLLAPLGWAAAGSVATIALLLLVAALRGASVLPGRETVRSAPALDAEGRADLALDTGFATEGVSWSRAFVGSSTQLDAPRLAPAEDGGLFVGATFGTEDAGGSIDLGGGPFASAGRWDGVLARLTVSGDLVWQRRLGGVGLDGVSDIASDGRGGIFAAGPYAGPIDLASGPLEAGNGTPTTWLARFEADGATAWSRTLARGDLDLVRVATRDDAIVVAGAFTGTIEVGGRSLTASGTHDLVVAAFSPEGDLRWLRALDGEGTEAAVDVAMTENGPIVAATLERVDSGGSATKGGDGAAPTRSAAVLLVALDNDGNERWTRLIEGAPATEAAAEPSTLTLAGIEATEDGGIVLAAALRGAIDLGAGTLESAGERDILLARFDADGTLTWNRLFGGDRDDLPLALAADDDRLLVSGVFRGRLDLDGHAIESSTNTDGGPSQNGFLATFTLEGEAATARVFGAPRSARGQELLVGAGGDVFASGRFLGLIDVGAGRLISTQSFLDSFLARVEP